MTTSDEELTVWVGGLDSQVTNEILWELFVQAGPVLQVKLPIDRETGEQRPFAFIAYKHPISGPYAERLFNGTKLFDKIIRVRYKGSQKFDQNKYHELYDGLLSRLSVENADKYGNIFEEIEVAKSGYIGNRVVYTEDESQFAGYNASRDYGNQHVTEEPRYNRNEYRHHQDYHGHRSRDQRDRHSGHHQSYHDNRNKPYHNHNQNHTGGYESRTNRQRGSRF